MTPITLEQLLTSPGDFGLGRRSASARCGAGAELPVAVSSFAGMPSPSIETVAAAKIPELRAFLKVQRAYLQWKEDFPSAARKLAAIAAEYGPCLEAGDHVVRERRVSAPPFELKHFAGKLRPEVLCEALGRGEFTRLGGRIGTRETFEIDRRVFDALVARKELPEALTEMAIVYIPHYARPGELLVP